MIFLKKLFHRPVGSKKKGSITVWLTLSFLVFLGLYLICLPVSYTHLTLPTTCEV